VKRTIIAAVLGALALAGMATGPAEARRDWRNDGCHNCGPGGWAAQRYRSHRYGYSHRSRGCQWIGVNGVYSQWLCNGVPTARVYNGR
jgi:hypothetical protein